jgi:hypothetical protein
MTTAATGPAAMIPMVPVGANQGKAVLQQREDDAGPRSLLPGHCYG